MGKTGNAFSEYRNVIIRFNTSEGQDIIDQDAQEAMGIDAYKAVIFKVAELEAQYADDNTSVTDKAAVSVVFTGTSRYKLYSFLLTLDISAADYTFVYVETVPNADSLS